MIEYNTKSDLLYLIDNSAVENIKLEFKKYCFEGGKITVNDKEALVKEIVAMANSDGGYIIVGIDEDGKRMASKLIDTGCTMSELDGIKLALQQYMLAKVRPRLYGVEMQGIAIDNDKIAIVINVPKSYSRPHAVNDGNKDVFYIRHSNGVTNMTVDDLRKQFLLSSSFKNDIRLFRQDRIGMILSNECIVNLADGAKILVHIIPLWSLEQSNFIDLRQMRQNPFISESGPISGGAYNYSFNADGFLTACSEYPNHQISTYAQFFRNGIVEALDIRMMNYQEKTVYYWEKTEVTVYKAIGRYSQILHRFNVPKPWYIYISLLSAKGYRSAGIYYDGIIDRDIIHATECIWNDEKESLGSILRPTFDSLANAFGRSQSSNYNADGIYIGEE